MRFNSLADFAKLVEADPVNMPETFYVTTEEYRWYQRQLDGLPIEQRTRSRMPIGDLMFHGVKLIINDGIEPKPTTETGTDQRDDSKELDSKVD